MLSIERPGGIKQDRAFYPNDPASMESIAPGDTTSTADDGETREATPPSWVDRDTPADAATAADRVEAALSPEASDRRRDVTRAAEELAHMISADAGVSHVASSPDGKMAVAVITGKNFFLVILNDGHNLKTGVVYGGLVGKDKPEFMDVRVDEDYYFVYRTFNRLTGGSITKIPLRPFMAGEEDRKEFLSLEQLGIDPAKPEGERLDAEKLRPLKEWWDLHGRRWS